MQPNTVIALAKPVHSVSEIDLPEDANELNMETQYVQCQGQGLEEEKLPVIVSSLSQTSGPYAC